MSAVALGISCINIRRLIGRPFKILTKTYIFVITTKAGAQKLIDVATSNPLDTGIFQYDESLILCRLIRCYYVVWYRCVVFDLFPFKLNKHLLSISASKRFIILKVTEL